MAEQNGHLNGNQQNGAAKLFKKQGLTPADRARLEREERIKDLLPDEDADRLDRVYDSNLLSRLFGYITPYRGRLIASIVMMSLAAILSVAGPWIIGRAIDDGIRTGSLITLRNWTIAFAIVSLVEWVANRSRISLMAYVGTRVVTDVRSAVFRHLHRLSLAFHNSYSVGRLMSRLISDVGVLQDFVTWSITGMARSVFVLGGIVLAMVVLKLAVGFDHLRSFTVCHHLIKLLAHAGSGCLSRRPTPAVLNQRLYERVDHRHAGDAKLHSRNTQCQTF